jgi:beta-galactosidase
LLFAYQTTLSDAALDAVARYKAAGGRLAYDLHFNRFDRYGQPRPDGAQALFGVSDDGCHNVTQKFIYRRQRIVLPQQPRNDCAYTTLSAAPGYTLTMPLFWRSRYGLMVRGARTLAFGFLPQLLEDRYKGDFWQQVYLDAIRELIDDPR